jgi:endonuclease/exonuclease/phosphatase family metal-dependent hydrolase
MARRLTSKRSLRGALTVLAMFALGGAVLWGLFLARRATSPRSPNISWGVPRGSVRVVSFDCGGKGFDELGDSVSEIRSCDADFVLLQQVPAEDLLRFVEALGLQKSHYTQLFQRTGRGGRDETGSLVLSKHPLYDAAGIRPDGKRGPCLGTWAVAERGGVKFAVVSARLDEAGAREQLARAWRDAGSLPVVVGVSPETDAATARGEWKPVGTSGAVLTDPRWHVIDRGGRWLDLSGTPAPAVVVGVPDRTLRLASYNIYHDYRGIERTTAEVRKLDPPPDFVFLEEVEPQNVRPWAEALGALSTYYPPVGRLPDGKTAWPDTAILSRHRLSEGKPLQTADSHTFGLWAWAVVDGKKFAVAAVHLWPTFGIDPRHVAFTAQKRNEQLGALIETWQKAGKPPLIVGGDFNQPAVGENYELMTRHFTDMLRAAGNIRGTFPMKFIELRIDYFLATPQWATVKGAVVDGDASDHRLVWLDAQRSLAPATRPTTAPK